MIAFSPTEEQTLIAETVKRFARERMRSVFREAEESSELPWEVVNKGWQLGLLSAAIPEDYGGLGDAQPTVTGALAAEELGWGDLALALAIMVPGLVALPILYAGTEEQKRTYLPRFSDEGYPKVTAALIEPRFRFDPAALETTAVRQGNEYVLSGRKAYVPLAAGAELFLIYAAEKGQTQAFLVERGAPGLTVGERERLMGVKALDTYELALDGVRVPASARLGGDAGIDINRLLNHSRVALAALAVGLARGAYEYALEYAKNRVAFGEPIAQRQSIAFMLAEMAIEIEGVRLSTWEAAWRLDQGEEATRECVLARQNANAMALMVADRAVQILGGHGYIREYPVELWLRNARGFATFDGLAMI
ncbi:MAG: acyl-CoA dehydrogenase [Herpetosiphonaceae bacterium]|nr:MAG: acyl-CoA dehydrogenase [Herpetosiphonaceae bacterium]